RRVERREVGVLIVFLADELDAVVGDAQDLGARDGDVLAVARVPRHHHELRGTRVAFGVHGAHGPHAGASGVDGGSGIERFEGACHGRTRVVRRDHVLLRSLASSTARARNSASFASERPRKWRSSDSLRTAFMLLRSDSDRRLSSAYTWSSRRAGNARMVGL